MGTPSNQLLGAGADFYRWIIQMLSNPGSRYRRLPSQNSRKRRVRIARLGSKRFLRLKRIPKLQFRWVSPIFLLTKLRDAYVNLMLAASSKMTSPELLSGNFAPAAGRLRPFGEIHAKEYEKKILVELYKSISENQLVLSSRS